MITKCANPACSSSFDHRDGRLFRFPKNPVGDGLPANTHSVQHFWLCGNCLQLYSLEYHEGRGVALARHFEAALSRAPRKFISAA
jgi:hypothetical protein